MHQQPTTVPVNIVPGDAQNLARAAQATEPAQGDDGPPFGIRARGKQLLGDVRLDIENPLPIRLGRSLQSSEGVLGEQPATDRVTEELLGAPNSPANRGKRVPGLDRDEERVGVSGGNIANRPLGPEMRDESVALDLEIERGPNRYIGSTEDVAIQKVAELDAFQLADRTTGIDQPDLDQLGVAIVGHPQKPCRCVSTQLQSVSDCRDHRFQFVLERQGVAVAHPPEANGSSLAGKGELNRHVAGGIT